MADASDGHDRLPGEQAARRARARRGARQRCSRRCRRARAGTTSRSRTARCASTCSTSLYVRTERDEHRVGFGPVSVSFRARSHGTPARPRRSADRPAARPHAAAERAVRAFSNARRARRALAGARRRAAPRSTGRGAPLAARVRAVAGAYGVNQLDQARRPPPRPQLDGPAAADRHAHAAVLPRRRTPRPRSPARAGARRACCPRPALRAGGRDGRSRASTSASTTRPTSLAGAALGTASGARAMKVGIVGMPNAGKSLAVQRADRRAGAEAANYPFTTIEPNVAVVPRAPTSASTRSPRRVGASDVVHDTIDFHDIAGLVAGAHKGEGWATSSWPTSARPTRSCTSCARTTTPTSSTPRATSTRCATSRRSRPS